MAFELDQSTDNSCLFDDVVVSYSKGMHEVGADAIASAQARKLLDTRVTQTEDNIESVSTDVTTLTNRVDGNDGDLSGLSSAVDTLGSRVTANDGELTSQGSAITTLDSRVDSTETGVSTNAGAISGLQTHASDVDGELDAQSSQLTELTAGTVVIDLVTPPGEDVSVATKGYTNAQATDALTARVTVNEDGITSQGTALTALENTVNDPATGVSANAAALDALETTVTLNGDTISSHGTAITGIENSINDPQTGLTASAGAIDSLETTVTQNGSDISANATSIGQISTTVGDHTAAIQTQSTSIDGLSAQWTLKAQTPDPLNPDFVKVSGIGLSSAPADGGGVESNLYLKADTIAFIDPADVTGASARYPFVVRGGVVYANEAMIEKITANQIDVTDLASISSNTGTLTADLIRTSPGAHGNRLEIGGTSLPFWFGSGGKTWNSPNTIAYMAGNGDVTFNNGWFRGDIEATSIKADAVSIVHTLNIAGNAVTVPMGDFSDGRVNQYNDTWQLMAKYYVPAGTFNQATSVFANFGAAWFAEVSLALAGDRFLTVKMRMVVNGVIVFTTEANRFLVPGGGPKSFQGLANFGRSLTIGTAAHDVRFEFQIETDTGVATNDRWTEDRYMTILALKR